MILGDIISDMDVLDGGENGMNTDDFIRINIFKEKSECVMSIRLSENQKKQLMMNAEQKGISVTSYILSKTLFSDEEDNSAFNKNEIIEKLNKKREEQKCSDKAVENIYFKITKTQKAALAHNAGVAGMTMTEFILTVTL